MKFIRNEEAHQKFVDFAGEEKIAEVVAALRTGKYVQHKRKMFDDDSNGLGPCKSGCCLHVISMEVDKAGVDASQWDAGEGLLARGLPINKDKQPISFFMNTLSYAAPTTIVGLLSFSTLNDSYLTHPQIAELIEVGSVDTEDKKWHTA